jgi:hypothetical protein
MSLSARDARALGGIEVALRGDPQLAPLFDTFTRLTLGEPISALEHVKSRKSRVLAALLLPVILASGIIAALTGGRSHSPAGCTQAPAVLSLHWAGPQPVPGRGRTARPVAGCAAPVAPLSLPLRARPSRQRHGAVGRRPQRRVPQVPALCAAGS